MEECICGNKNRNIWDEICEESENEKDFVRKYLANTNGHSELPAHPQVEFFEKELLPSLKKALLSCLQEAEVNNIYESKTQRTPFDSIDHIAEYLWTHNAKYPERVGKYESIHDMDWVKKCLKDNPRPYYPFHQIWSDDFAALKIQSHMRGHWVRRRPDIQEVRQFWKQLKDEARSSGTSISRRFYMD